MKDLRKSSHWVPVRQEFTANGTQVKASCLCKDSFLWCYSKLSLWVSVPTRGRNLQQIQTVEEASVFVLLSRGHCYILCMYEYVIYKSHLFFDFK